MWKENLINNLLVIFILVVIALIIWSKVTGKTLSEMVQEIRGMFTPKEVIEQ